VGFNCPIGPTYIQAADANQDGLTDLAVLGAGGDPLAVLFQTSEGGFCSASYLVVEGSPAAGRAMVPYAVSPTNAPHDFAVVYTAGGQQNQESVTFLQGGTG
jgi:hypothetical protein